MGIWKVKKNIESLVSILFYTFLCSILGRGWHWACQLSVIMVEKIWITKKDHKHLMAWEMLELCNILKLMHGKGER